MTSIIQLVAGIGVLPAFIWLLIGNTPSTTNSSQQNEEFLDPNDNRQLATLIDLTGGDIVDAAVARFAIQRFQEQYGRSPTTRDVGTIVGIMRSL